MVGVGASAGGLKALLQLLSAMPERPGLSLVIIQHLDPTKESLSAELLDRKTSLPVIQVQDEPRVELNHVYVLPPNKYLSIQDGVLRLTDPEHRRGVRVPVDHFLRSLAVDQCEKAVAIILSGTGTDGTLGVKAVKSHGGLVIVQSPEMADFAGMPQSALGTGIVDYALPVKEIADRLLRYAEHPYLLQSEPAPAAGEDTESSLGSVLALLRTRARHDFRSYKQTTILRRTQRRMGLLGISESPEYLDYLRGHSEEVDALVKDLLISVTDFFRDPEAWKVLERDVIVSLLEAKEPDAPIRIWVPGCATGEEPYTVAMLLLEQMQRLGQNRPLQVFASDIDKSALDHARRGRYPDTIRADVSRERLQQFFTHETDDHHYHVSKRLREPVVFAEQNLISDPPYSRLDLICCRNLLIYLQPDIQQKIIALFHFALVDDGCLFLGNAETIGRQEDMFAAVSQKWRIYRRTGPTRHEKVEFPIVGGLPRRDLEPVTLPTERPETRLAHLAQERLLDWIAPAAVLVDAQGDIHYYNGETDAYLTHSTGVPTQNLFSKARQGLRTKLRGLLQTAAEGRTVSLDARVKRDGHFHPVRLTARAIHDSQHDESMVLIMFEDVERHGTQKPPQPFASQEPTDIDSDSVVRHLEDELAATKEDLQTTIEQLESSNEEFKAANEEVMSINEEVQSTNEELETSKEELQSLNEELNTVNQQLATKVDELQASNDDLANLLSSTDLATLCLDRDLSIKWFTPATNRLINLVTSDVGRPLADFSHRFASDDLLEDARQVMERLTPVENEVTTMEDVTYLRRITPYRTEDNRIDGIVLTFVDISERKRLEAALRKQELFESIVAAVREPLLVLDSALNVVAANRAFFTKFTLSEDRTVGRAVYELSDGEWNIPQLREQLNRVLTEDSAIDDFEVEHEFDEIGLRTMVLNARRVESLDLILLAIEDVTDGQRNRELTRLRDSLEVEVDRQLQVRGILQDVTLAANEAANVEVAMQATLRRICDYNNWVIAFGSVDWRHDSVTTNDADRLRKTAEAVVPTMVPSCLKAADDPVLGRLNAAWPALPDAIKAAILALLDASGEAAQDSR